MRRTENDTQEECKFCHIQEASKQIEEEISLKGLYLLTLVFLRVITAAAKLQVCGHNRNIILITQRDSEGQAKSLFSELEGIDIDSVCNV